MVLTVSDRYSSSPRVSSVTCPARYDDTHLYCFSYLLHGPPGAGKTTLGESAVSLLLWSSLMIVVQLPLWRVN